MALNFPASPANGDTHDDTSNGIRYIYNSTKNQWTALAEFTTGAIGAQKLDDLQSSFQGTNKVFTLKVDGSTVKPHDSRSITVYINNVIQKAETDYTVNSGTGQITFTSAPAATDTFYGIVLARLPLAVDQLPLTGGTMTGDINFSTTQVIPHDQIQSATTNRFGVTKLNNVTDSTSTTLAASSKAVKDTKDAADAAATTANAALPKAGGTMTGDITFNSTQQFDGRDLSADGARLDLIADNANNYSISSDLLDEDDMASDSASKVASQQSIKAYVDAHTGATDLSYTASSRELASSTGTNVNLPEATTSAAGLQSSADKTKLDGIETGATADQTGAEIKSAYEGEADTNAFTDADHTKLDGIATGAEVNVNADWNSTSGDSQILNKPTLVSALNDLSDVSAASPSTNQIIKWNGSAWALAADGGSGGGTDIFINTLSSSSGSGGGSATFNGTATRFTLSNPPSVSAQQLLVSINGVIQKPNSGTSPSEGFAIDGNDIIFAAAPATGSDFFIVTYGSLNIAVPADNSVTSAKIVDGAIINDDINASAAIDGTKISPDFGSQNIVTTGGLTIDTSTLHVDTSNNRVGIGTASPTKKLTVFGTGAGEATLQIEGEDGADPYINFLANNTQHWSAGIDDSDNDSFKIAKHSALGTNDYLVVDTSGKVGINDSSPESKLTVHSTDRHVQQLIAENGVAANTTSGTIYRQQYTTAGTSRRMGFFGIKRKGGSGDQTANFVMELCPDNSTNLGLASPASYTTAFTFTNTGMMEVKSGGGVRFHNYGDGTGIDSNLLDDYEEGTFTPEIKGTDGSTPASYYHQEGGYTKIGRLVTCIMRIKINDGTGLNGDIMLDNLPFNVLRVNSSTGLAGFGHPAYFTAANSNLTTIVCTPVGGGDTAYFYGQASASNGMGSLSTTYINSNFDIRLYITYYAA